MNSIEMNMNDELEKSMDEKQKRESIIIEMRTI